MAANEASGPVAIGPGRGRRRGILIAVAGMVAGALLSAILVRTATADPTRSAAPAAAGSASAGAVKHVVIVADNTFTGATTGSYDWVDIPDAVTPAISVGGSRNAFFLATFSAHSICTGSLHMACFVRS